MISEKHISSFFVFSLLCILVQIAYGRDNQEIYVEKHTAFSSDNQQFYSFSTDRYSNFLRRIQYNRSSIEQFFTQAYNDPLYAEHFLALDFSHLMQLLQFNTLSTEPNSYTRSVIKLFGQKLKSAAYVNAWACEYLLDALPVTIGKQFPQNGKKTKTSIKECLYDFLISNFHSLKTDPDSALDDLSAKIYKITHGKEGHTELAIADLQSVVKEFLEITLSKIIWSVEDQHDIWPNVKSIAQKLDILHQCNIVGSHEALNELQWTLISRFAYFLSMAEELDLSCYMLMEQDLNAATEQLWSSEELEECITSKGAFLKHAIVQAQIRSHAFAKGIITDSIVPLYTPASR